MSTFSGWWLSQNKNPDPRQINYLCGTERVLIDYIVDSIKDELKLEPWNFIPLVAGEDSERTIWAEVDQHPMNNQPRLVLIRAAQKLKQWERLEAFTRNRTANPKTYLVFVSDEERVPTAELTAAERNDHKKPKAMPYLMLGAKGHVVECRPFTQATAKHALAWVQTQVPMRPVVAGHLLDRANGDLRLVRDVCVKLALYGGEITLSTVNEMLTEQPRDSFADALIALDKKTALNALERVPTEDYGRIIGMLDSTLDLAGLVHDSTLQHMTPGAIARAAGTRGFLVPEIMKVSKHYDENRRYAIRKMLSTVDEAYRSGARIGLLESIVMFW